MYRFLDHPVGVEVANAVDVAGAPVLGGDVGVAPVNRGGRGQAGGHHGGNQARGNNHGVFRGRVGPRGNGNYHQTFAHLLRFSNVIDYCSQNENE